eukprot:1482553-Alexandrium_andersonii.AAC.1
MANDAMQILEAGHHDNLWHCKQIVLLANLLVPDRRGAVHIYDANSNPDSSHGGIGETLHAGVRNIMPSAR